MLKGTHHGSHDGCSTELITGLSPQDIIFCVWQSVQPRNTTLTRLCGETNARLYATASNAKYHSQEYGTYTNRFYADHGHIVVRVEKGGDSYKIYQLDDSDKTMSMKILKTFGPYNCK